MAQCVRLPRTWAGVLQVSSRIQQRSFTQNSSRGAVGGGARQLQPQQPRSGAERSVRLATKDLNMMASDLGLLPETFIAPSGKNRPPVFTRPRTALKFNWARLKRKFQDLLSLNIYKYYTRKPRIKLRFRQTAPTAVALHRQMYMAFAEGDLNSLKTICADGLLDSFSARVHARERVNETAKWEIVRYNKRARVMSNRAATLQLEGAGIRQAVVRICSRQRLTRYNSDGLVIPGSGQEKDICEYVVIQKMLLLGKEHEWTVWGTTEETTPEKLEDERRALLE